jgi:hypothetical protein
MSEVQSPQIDFSKYATAPVTITPDPPPPIDFSSIGGQRVTSPKIDYDALAQQHGGKPVVTITPDTMMNRYFASGQGVQDFTSGSTDEQAFLKRFPDAKKIRSWPTTMPPTTETETPEARTATQTKEAQKGLATAGAIFGGVVAPELLAPEARVIGTSLLAGIGAGAGHMAGTTSGGGNPFEVGNLKEAGKVAGTTALGSAIIGGGLSFLQRILSPEVAAAAPATEAWQKANSVLGVKPSAIRIGEQATGIEQAATNPGRTLVKVGLDGDRLASMTPVERQAAIAPQLNKAGQAIRDSIDGATQAGVTLDAGKSTFGIVKGIRNPLLQQQAVDALSAIQHELGIENLRSATPAEARDFRDALKYGARFSAGGDLWSLADVRANLYRAVSSDLEGAVPNLDKLNEAYSDLKEGAKAARNATAKAAVTAPEPPPTGLQKVSEAAEKALPIARTLGYGAGGIGGALGAYRLLRDMSSP